VRDVSTVVETIAKGWQTRLQKGVAYLEGVTPTFDFRPNGSELFAKANHRVVAIRNA
jgi:hypothetical protein